MSGLLDKAKEAEASKNVAAEVATVASETSDVVVSSSAEAHD